MISVDTVYQKVLALANKEQRGYITPQEFHLLADKAQMDIFESYFHDMKTAYHKQKNNTNFSDELEIIEEKLHGFYTEDSVAVGQEFDPGSITYAFLELPPSVYRLKNVLTQRYHTIEEVTEKEYHFIKNNPLTSPTSIRPIYIRHKKLSLKIYPFPFEEPQNYIITYWRRPISPNWPYVIVNEKPLYNSNPNLVINFELHASEEEFLVTRILQLAGVTIKKPDIVEIAMTDNAQIKQEQNN
tara:strand:- start:734 stop:1459 length:726 start_codon:yes stop_codon:yes gene_type:complete